MSLAKKIHLCPACQDLAGFWDMVHIQVEQIHNRFDDLRDLKRMNWVVKVSFLIIHLDKNYHDHDHEPELSN